MRICVFCERLALPLDEGIKNHAACLIAALRKGHEVLALTTFGEDIPALGIANIPSNRLLLSGALARAIRAFGPDLVLYIPTACATLFSFLRGRVLRRHARGAPVALLALQPRAYSWLARVLMPRLCPEVTLVQAERTWRSLEGVDCVVRRVSPGVDTTRFAPASETRRVTLRQRYGLALDRYVILHVGHLNRARNIQALAALQEERGNQVVVVGSTSTSQDHALVEELRAAGMVVIDRFVPDIVELYQLADCYVFPAHVPTACIDAPLSVLEAMACNLPVITTRYGGLPALFEEGPGFTYADDETQLRAAVQASKSSRPATRAMVTPLAWPQVAEQMLETIRQALSDVSCPLSDSRTGA